MAEMRSPEQRTIPPPRQLTGKQIVFSVLPLMANELMIALGLVCCGR